MAVHGGTGAKVAEKNRGKLKEPEDFRVVLLNDNYTTMEFVIEILVTIFHKSDGEANRIMLDVHRKGKGLVGMYPWDIAQTKIGEVHALARKNDFPLKCIVE
ncbi:MAG: ATP-dependent Clp protease adaptor ClpS [Treponema sp.]|nr:ATP-dependent Clp protease adaptor ClpS [Treponema sp.]